MLHFIRECVRTVALAERGGAHAYRACVRRLAERRFRRMFPGLDATADAATVFDRFCKDNAWGSAETASGPGSILAYTAQLQASLPQLFELLGDRPRRVVSDWVPGLAKRNLSMRSREQVACRS
jgi:hypothetical protein